MKNQKKIIKNKKWQNNNSENLNEFALRPF